jgi:D-glycero-alpha-D-manno-heptose-7-phosphate kinase
MIISQTPLRISLCGGGTDFPDYYKTNEGFVISSTIDKFIYVVIKERFDDLIYIGYSQKEIVHSVDEIQHELVREAARKTGLKNGFEVSMLADIPSEGSGLGSSSSLTVGLLNAFYQYQGIQVTAEQLARVACEIEIDILNKPIGKQDQYIAAYGGLCTIKFKKDSKVEVEKLQITNELKRRVGSNLLLFFTNVTRKSSIILDEQKINIPDKLEYHDEIKDLAYKTRDYILKGDFNKIGEVLHRNWELKKCLSSNISNAFIDNMYNCALDGGATGGKIAGAGGGGFLLVYCKRNNQDRLREAMKDYREMSFFLESSGSKIIFNYTRYEWK